MSMLMLDEDQSFTLTGYVESPGYQSIVLKGYLISKRSDGTYIAPLIPQLFYGVSGEQLRTWRQWIPSAGEQVLLSRVAGMPEVPREELWWRKVAEPAVKEEVEEKAVAVPMLEVTSSVLAIFALGLGFGILLFKQ